jgi:hypothetical protein
MTTAGGSAAAEAAVTIGAGMTDDAVSVRTNADGTSDRGSVGTIGTGGTAIIISGCDASDAGDSMASSSPDS